MKFKQHEEEYCALSDLISEVFKAMAVFPWIIDVYRMVIKLVRHQQSFFALAQ